MNDEAAVFNCESCDKATGEPKKCPHCNRMECPACRKRCKQHFVMRRHEDALTFGRMLEILRKAKGWTQSELGTRAGVSSQFISDLEYERVKVSLERACMFAKAFDMNERVFVALALEQRLRAADLPYRVKLVDKSVDLIMLPCEGLVTAGDEVEVGPNSKVRRHSNRAIGVACDDADSGDTILCCLYDNNRVTPGRGPDDG